MCGGWWSVAWTKAAVSLTLNCTLGGLSVGIFLLLSHVENGFLLHWSNDGVDIDLIAFT